jgi:hypothetical protein
MLFCYHGNWESKAEEELKGTKQNGCKTAGIRRGGEDVYGFGLNILSII